MFFVEYHVLINKNILQKKKDYIFMTQYHCKQKHTMSAANTLKSMTSSNTDVFKFYPSPSARQSGCMS